MKINKIEINNFRNIKHAEYEFSEGTTILAGKNGIGKTNTLNALTWFLSTTILTDAKDIISSGEMDTIIPSNYQKGMDTEVSVWIGGTKFTKRYRTTYQRGTDTVNGHTTDYYVNDVACKNETNFVDELFPKLNYQPCFTKLNIKEANLFIDPLYALQKLEPKELRNLLAALGCSVTNEELYALGYEELREYEGKYNGKFDVMRQDLKKTKDKQLKEIETLEANLEPFASAVEFNDSKLKETEAKKVELINKKSKLKNNDFNGELAEIDLEIKKVENSHQIEVDKIDNKYASQSLDLDANVKRLTTQVQDKNSSISRYRNEISNNTQKIKGLVLDAKRLQANKSEYTVKLNATMGRSYNNYIVCPHCGESFPASQESLDNFNKDKEEQIKSLKESIVKCSSEYQGLGAQVKACENDNATCNVEINKLENEIKELNDKISALNISISNVEARKNQELIPINNNFNNQIANLKNKRTSLLSSTSEEVEKQISEIDLQITELDGIIRDEYVNQSRWESKKSYEEKLEADRVALNNTEYLLKLVNNFIQAMISKINEKATEKTGIKFVMLEDQLNGGVKEVCYATLNGLPFTSNINTAMKVELGIKFIEKVKEIAVNDFGVPHNDLPILADRFEGIDLTSKIFNLTKEQLICTRVSTEDTITILKEDK